MKKKVSKTKSKKAKLTNWGGVTKKSFTKVVIPGAMTDRVFAFIPAPGVPGPVPVL
jgi:hypothetical protein